MLKKEVKENFPEQQSISYSSTGIGSSIDQKRSPQKMRGTQEQLSLPLPRICSKEQSTNFESFGQFKQSVKQMKDNSQLKTARSIPTEVGFDSKRRTKTLHSTQTGGGHLDSSRSKLNSSYQDDTKTLKKGIKSFKANPATQIRELQERMIIKMGPNNEEEELDIEAFEEQKTWVESQRDDSPSRFINKSQSLNALLSVYIRNLKKQSNKPDFGMTFRPNNNIIKKTPLISGSELSEREYKLLKKAEEKKEQNTPEIKKIVGKKMGFTLRIASEDAPMTYHDQLSPFYSSRNQPTLHQKWQNQEIIKQNTLSPFNKNTKKSQVIASSSYLRDLSPVNIRFKNNQSQASSTRIGGFSPVNNRSKNGQFTGLIKKPTILPAVSFEQIKTEATAKLDQLRDPIIQFQKAVTQRDVVDASFNEVRADSLYYAKVSRIYSQIQKKYQVESQQDIIANTPRRNRTNKELEEYLKDLVSKKNSMNNNNNNNSHIGSKFTKSQLPFSRSQAVLMQKEINQTITLL